MDCISTGMRTAAHLLVALLVGALTTSCYPIKQYRQTDTPQPVDCREDTAPDECSYVLHQAAASSNKFTLVVVESDDQGTHYSPAQLQKALALLSAPPDAEFAGQIVVAFAHGWFHDARPGDQNLQFFSQMLEMMAANELAAAAEKVPARKPRRVVGVFLAWRGDSWKVPGLNYLTFWNRKETAQRIGERQVTESLIKIRQTAYAAPKGPDVHNHWIVMGHSFGGALVYSALSQLMTNALLSPPQTGASESVPPIADAVILFNPALEAAQMHHLLEIAAQLEGRRPSLAVLTSKSDRATGWVFPAARAIDTVFDSFRDVPNPIRQGDVVSEREANSRAIGHFEPYLTHDLLAIAGHETPCGASVTGPDPDAVRTAGPRPKGDPSAGLRKRAQLRRKTRATLEEIVAGFNRDEPKLPFGYTCLVRRAGLSQAKLAVINVAMDEDVWDGHALEQDDAQRKRIMSFLHFFVPFAAARARVVPEHEMLDIAPPPGLPRAQPDGALAPPSDRSLRMQRPVYEEF